MKLFLVNDRQRGSKRRSSSWPAIEREKKGIDGDRIETSAWVVGPLSGRTIVGTKTRRPRDRGISVRRGNNEEKKRLRRTLPANDDPQERVSFRSFSFFFFVSLLLSTLVGLGLSTPGGEVIKQEIPRDATVENLHFLLLQFLSCHSDLWKSRLPLRFREWQIFYDFTASVARKQLRNTLESTRPASTLSWLQNSPYTKSRIYVRISMCIFKNATQSCDVISRVFDIDQYIY